MHSLHVHDITQLFRDSSSDARGQKRNHPDSADVSSLPQDAKLEETEDGLKVWGYMPGHVHYKVGAVEDVSSGKTRFCSI